MLTDETDKRAVEKARSVLRANLGAGFEELAPHLRSLLENLPILEMDAPILQAYPASKSAHSTIEGVMEYLRREWIATKVSEYETIGASSIADEAELLSIAFNGNIWSVGYMEKQIIVARTGDDRFRSWCYQASGGVWGNAPGEYETPRLSPTAPKVRPRAPGTGEEASSARPPGFFAQVREWFGRLLRQR